ncbi:protein kinase [Spiractinospora alimapuensis]|uniref:serine/threonine protein kinase n=1 Tax=Spiractinospora alimapuensis TaxID=2820884 RepID=UPI001F2C8C17|nr:serine/threonine-protein kinase [Spiractinospora alimapuensis]QVQ51597.1 protein kinase [Spiractinospora alimapuensis]
MSSPHPSAPPELTAPHADDPRQLGPYRVIGRLGAGGMGTVYAALDVDDTCVAVKVIKPELAGLPAYRDTFAREVAVMRDLSVVCAPRFLGADAEAEQPWLATEFVPGLTLTGHVRRHGPLTGNALLAFAAGTAEALHTLHIASVLHRDIKPGNVVLSPDGPRVLDFGIARRAQDRSPEEGVYGTPGYMSPERIAGGDDTTAADVFAWGGLVAFAATGRPPFGVGDTGAVLDRTRNGTPDLLGVPPDLAELLERALSPVAADRPLALECFRESLALASGTPETAAAHPSEARIRLAALLGNVWRGFDAAGHDPRAWVALAGGVGLVGAAAVATSASTAAGGSAVAGTASAGAGGTVSAASMTTATTGTAAGLFTTKTVAIAAGGTLAVAAVGTGGYYAVDAQAASQRQEIVEQAAQVLADGEGFAAEFTRQFTAERADEYSVASGTAVEEVLQATATGFDVRYATDPVPIFMAELSEIDGEAVDVPDQRNEIVANVDGEIHAYGTSMRDPASWFATTDRFTEDSYSVDSIVEPLRRLATADDLTDEGDETLGDTTTTRYSGSFLAPRGLGETVGELDATGEVWIDDAGNPVQMAYTTSGWEATVTFTELDAPVEVAEPEVEYNVQSAMHTLLVYTPGCGTVNTPDGSAFTVHADAWDVDCDRAMTVAEEFVSGGGEFVEGWSGTGIQRAFFDDMSCEQVAPMLEAGGRDATVPQYCNPTTVNEAAADPYDRYDIDMSTWSIVFIPEDPQVAGPIADPRHSTRTE